MCMKHVFNSHFVFGVCQSLNQPLPVNVALTSLIFELPFSKKNIELLTHRLLAFARFYNNRCKFFFFFFLIMIIVSFFLLFIIVVLSL